MRASALLAVVVTLAAFGGHVSAQDERRTFIPGEWVELVRVGGLESPLVTPSLMKAGAEFFVVYDYSEKAVQAFSYHGKLLWQAGRSGAGPNEFANPTDLQIGPANTIWVTDPENVRLSIIAPSGEFTRLVRLPPTVIRCAPSGEQSCWSATSDTATMVVHLDLAAGVREKIPAPDWLRRVYLFSRETVLEAGPESKVVLGYLYHDRWGVLESGKPIAIRGGVQKVPFAKMLQWRTTGGYQVTRIDTAAVEAGRSISLSGGRVHILFGAGETRGSSLVDTYDLETGRYQGSYRLPEEVDRMAVSPSGLVVTLVRDPIPTARVWRFSGISGSGRVPDGR